MGRREVAGTDREPTWDRGRLGLSRVEDGESGGVRFRLVGDAVLYLCGHYVKLRKKVPL